MKEALEKAKGQERRWEETKCKMDENLRIANEQVAQLNAARNKYEKTKEYGKLIEVYESILSPLPTTWNSLSHTFLLVEYYQKDNQRDKAWTLLNSILLKYPNEACRVRRAQYRLLKREKNFSEALKTSVYKGYKQDKIEMRGDRAEMSDFPLYLNTVAGGLDRRDQTIGGFSFVVKIYAVPVVEIIG